MGALPVLVENLVVRYGSKTAVAGVTFSVKPDEIYGLLGPNGAGKSSVIKVMVGLAQPASGSARSTCSPSLSARSWVYLTTSPSLERLATR